MQNTTGGALDGRDDDGDDEAVEIRYSLTALGETVLAGKKAARFRGFGPCALPLLTNRA